MGILGWEQADLVTVNPSPCPAPARSGWTITVRYSVSTKACGDCVLAGRTSHLRFSPHQPLAWRARFPAGAQSEAP